MIRSAALLLAFVNCSAAQTPIENTGKPMRVPLECTEADTGRRPELLRRRALPGVSGTGQRGSRGKQDFSHRESSHPHPTLYSILLATEDAGNTWIEPHPRIRASGLDQIQFIDFQNGWISGANLQSAPRDPFLLITTDGGKTWRQRPIFDESRVASSSASGSIRAKMELC